MKFPYPQKFLVAIVFVPGQRPKKYQHGIKDTPHYVQKFCNDMKRKFSTAEYVNFYDKGSQTFKERIYLQ